MLDKNFPFYVLIFFLTLLITAMTERRIIPFLRKKAKQPIYEGGPKWHISKSGTPTMGGLAFLIAASISLLIASLILFCEEQAKEAISLLLTLAFAIANACIGLFDDMTKLRKKENAGLTPRQKIILQFICCLIFLASRHFLLGATTSIYFSFGKLELGYFYYPLAIFILLGLINSANLTDGIDGLASSVAFSIGTVVFYISVSLNATLAFIASAMIGASVGFLFFNMHPAKIFMGDTGSLFLGALVSASSLVMDNPLIMLLIASVYVIEGASVVIQVFIYKMTKKRVFKMAPLHHHLERCGFTENKICLCAIFTTFICALPAYIFYLP